MSRILFVDDELYMRKIITKILETEGHQVFCATDGKEGINRYQQLKPDLIILDYKLPDIDGICVLREIKSRDDEAKIIMLTAHGNIKNAVQAMKMGAYDYLTKPFENNELLKLVTESVKTKLQADLIPDLQKNNHDDLVRTMGNSPAILQVMEQVKIVATNDITVLLEGDTGTGKEWLARLIHGLSSRKLNPFIAIDCGAIPETLFESELFGYEKGAFTGAHQARKGKFELAHKGTLFLDELNNLSPHLQAKLLRVLEEKNVQRLGGKSPLPIDVRIIVASNKNIVKEVSEGHFRRDLFFRLSEFKIDIPSLKERGNDIVVLSEYMIQEANRKFGKQVKSVSREALRAMLDYDWPGNIRELRNVIRRAVLLAKGEVIGVENLVFLHVHSSSSPQELDLNTVAGQIELDTIRKALSKTCGNKTAAAEILGISKRQFYRKLRKYNL